MEKSTSSGSLEHVALARAIGLIKSFGGADLSTSLAAIEHSIRGASTRDLPAFLETHGASSEALAGAAAIKRVVGQINVIIHALGILLCLPHILEPDETVEYISLGAGNTGRPFDLETTFRVAEFKFIQWRGGAESIRQNAVFKDFFLLAEHESRKRKYLYVLGSAQPLKFFNGTRALSSVLSGHASVARRWLETYGTQYRTVRDYYRPRKDVVVVEDISRFVPALTAFSDE